MFTISKPHATGLDEEFVEEAPISFQADLRHAGDAFSILENDNRILFQIERRQRELLNASGHEGGIIAPMGF